MNHRTASIAICLSLMAPICGCTMNVSAGTGETTESRGSANVSGTLLGQDVRFACAEFDGQLAITMDGDWAFNTSLLIFLFLDGDEIPAGQTIEVSPDDNKFMSRPHIHCRLKDETTGDTNTEIYLGDYDLKLRFAEVQDGHLPGEFQFSVPGHDTLLAGSFRAVIKEWGR